MNTDTGSSPSLHRLQVIASAMVPDDVVAICRNANGDVSELFAEERQAIHHTVAKRQAEFAAGRWAARAALQQLGQAPVAIAVGPGRSPIWPPGFAGSISHCQSAAIAVAAPLTTPVRHLGIDVEEVDAIETELWDSICTPGEMRWLKDRTDAGRWAKVIFSIKEAVYKAQYPLTGRLLGFHDVEVVVQDLTRSFSARLTVGKVKAVNGCFRTDEEYILAFASAADPGR